LCLVPPRRGLGRLDRAGRAWRAWPGWLLRRLLRAQRRRLEPARLCRAGRSQDRRSGVVQRRSGGQPGAGDFVRRFEDAPRLGADGRAAARSDEARTGGAACGGGEPLMCVCCPEVSRRSLLIGGAAAAAALTTGVAQARVLPRDMVPLVGPGYRPTEKDEQGIWQLMDRAEEEISGSNLLITDPKLTGYLRDIIG